MNRIQALPTAVLALILAVTAATYSPTLHYEFVFDDQGYILGNPAVRNGFTLESLTWAFTTFYQGNWHPLTWLTHLADVHFFGLDAGKHHILNIALHLANTLLLYVVLRRMTGAIWRSLVVAGLFALHPFRVESVAWISERKDLLCAFFWYLALLAWSSYLKRPNRGRYAAVAVLFSLGLMSKPMIITFPLTLLALDMWPLGRLGTRRDVLPLLREKLPLLLLSASAAVVTPLAQTSAAAVGSLLDYPISSRLANMVLAYATYLAKMAWPANLAAFYPHRGETELWLVALATLFLAVSTGLAWRYRRRGYPAAGWCWYLGTLVPVIGVVQVGDQALADRYTYVPLTGIFIIVVWGLTELSTTLRRRRQFGIVLASAALATLAGLSSLQVRYWKNEIALFGHAVEVVPDNWLAYSNLGVALSRDRRYSEALPMFQAALEIYPDHYETLYHFGRLLGSMGRKAEGILMLEKAIANRPNSHIAYVYLGYAYVGMRNKSAATEVYRRLAAVNPEQAAKLLVFVNTLP